MNKKLLGISIVVLAIVIWFLVGSKLFNFSSRLSDIEKAADTVVDEIKKEIINPPPLRALKESEQALLTQAGTLKWTNLQRTGNGLAPLIENAKLNSAASRKVQDMFNRQYFEHVSPDGKNVGDLVEGYGYAYISVGENLALGNYKNDQELVQAWMDSPGHRANILSTKFTEVGVAVGKGLFEGRQTWLAVQTFARPLSACPQANETLKAQIDWLELQIAELKVKADTLLSEMENYKKNGNHNEYNRKIEEYNTLVKQINDLVAQIKELIIRYNEQVRVFNSCIAGS